MFKIGDKVKNRFRQNNDFQCTQFGTVVGYDGCLLLVKIENRSYEGLKTNYSYCVESDWIPA